MSLSKAFRFSRMWGRGVTYPKYDVDRYPTMDYKRETIDVPPCEITGNQKFGHGFDFASDQCDYEDHSYHMLHQRHTGKRWSFIYFVLVFAIPFTYYTCLEMPFHGALFGQYKMDIEDNALKATLYDENYHDWSALKQDYLAWVEKQDEEDDEDEDDEDEDEDEDEEEEEEEEEAEDADEEEAADDDEDEDDE